MRKLGRILLVAGMAIPILIRGGTDQIVVLCATVLLIGACAIATLSGPINRRAATSANAAFGLCALLVAYVLFQSWSFDGNPFAHPIWFEAHGFDLALSHAISVEPAVTRAAIFKLALPFLTYFAVLSLFDTDELAERFIGILAWSGGVFAVFGIAQLQFFPDSLLFSAKTAYREHVTGFFVNRNTAGTFLGLASLAALAHLLSRLSMGGRFARFPAILLDSDVPRVRRIELFGLIIVLFLCLLSLFLTRSRGALLATLAAYMVAIPWLVVTLGGFRLKLASSRTAGWQASVLQTGWKIGLALAGLVLVLVVVEIFAGQTLYRLDRQSADVGRLCVYRATWRAFLDNWLWGTGFGTFDTVFPMYRQEGCGYLYSSFVRAHNSYLEALLGLGILFIPVALYAYAHIARNLLTGIATRQRKRFYPILATAAVILVSSHALVDFSLQIPGLAVYFAALLAACTVISVQRGAVGETMLRSRGTGSKPPVAPLLSVAPRR